MCWTRIESELRAAGVVDQYDVEFDPETRDLVLIRDCFDRRHFNFGPAIIRHSRTGMDWGSAGGSAAADCALNALLAYTADRELALRHYQAFNRAFICELPYEGGTIAGTRIFDWLLAQSPALPMM